MMPAVGEVYRQPATGHLWSVATTSSVIVSLHRIGSNGVWLLARETWGAALRCRELVRAPS